MTKAGNAAQRPAIKPLSGGLTILAIAVSIDAIDQPATGYLKSLANDSIIATAALLAILGSPVPYFVASAVAFALFKFERQQTIYANRALFILLASTTAPFCADMLKLVFGRARPHLWIEQGIYTFRPLTNSLDFSSFPSEEATVAAAMATTFSVLMPAYRPTFLLVATVVALSPIMIGMHYPSDAIAGALVGLTAVSILGAIFRHCGFELSKTQ
jgi:membrane-associated phospholipid phosphatase